MGECDMHKLIRDVLEKDVLEKDVWKEYLMIFAALCYHTCCVKCVRQYLYIEHCQMARPTIERRSRISEPRTHSILTVADIDGDRDLPNSSLNKYHLTAHIET